MSFLPRVYVLIHEYFSLFDIKSNFESAREMLAVKNLTDGCGSCIAATAVEARVPPPTGGSHSRDIACNFSSSVITFMFFK